MPAKPVAIFCAFGVVAAFSLASLQPVAAGKPAPPTILLYAASPADVTAMADLRTRLRLDGQLQVLTYDTESAIVQRIAAETSHPEWLVGPALTDDTRLALARALGVTYYAVISPGRGADSTHIQLVETAPTARIFDWVGVNRQYGAHAIESQAVLALPAAGVTIIASAPLPAVASAPLPAVASAPLPAVASAPLPAVASAPLPAVAPAPLPAVAPAALPAVAPAALPAVAPAALPAVAPAALPVIAPAALPVIAPAALPVIAPAALPVIAPAALPVIAPAPLPVIAPAPLPVIASAPLPVIASAPLPVIAPAALPVIAPAALPVIAPAALPVIAPAALPVIAPAALPVIAPAALPVIAPAALPVIAPAALPVIAPAALPVIAPAALPVIAPAALPVIAPAALPVIAPAALPVKPQIVIAKPVVTLPAPVVAAVPAPVMKPVLPPSIQVARLPQEVPAFALPLSTPPVQPAVPESIRSATPNSSAGGPLPSPTQARAADLSGITSLLRKGDSALLGGDIVGAISSYRKAVNGAPLSVIPRLKLAQAYQKGGMSEKSLDEARRALEIAPDSLSVQQFLTQLDTDNGTSDGAMTRYRAMLDRNPADPAAHTGLAEALWNIGDIPGAEAEYKAAKKFAPAGNHSADAHLAQLYASQARYDECLTALSDSGKDGYALAIRIVKNRADTFSSTVDASREGFAGGKSTREQFYDGAKKVSAQSQALAAFVAKIVPPAEFRLSHLHRMLATNLLAQEAATLVTFIETGDAKLGDGVSQLDKEVQMEMLTARAAEEKHGMWEVNKVEATKIEANQ